MKGLKTGGRQRITTHGEFIPGTGRASAEYQSYCAAKQRCTDPNQNRFHRYGGRGIQFRFTSFEQFLRHVGRKPSPKHSLDRYPNNDGHYEVGNVRWATQQEQCRNMRTNRYITADGVSRLAGQWAEIKGIKSDTIAMRLHRGWCDECAVNLPVRVNGGSTRCSHIPPVVRPRDLVTGRFLRSPKGK